MKDVPLNQRFTLNGRIFISLLMGLTVGYLRVQLAFAVGVGAGDFFYSMRVIRDLWAGRDPFAYAPQPDLVTYPLPAGLLSAPFAIFPDELAGGLFIGFSTALLAWFLLEQGKLWRLSLFLSWPFIYAVFFVQYSPLMACVWFAPVLLPLILVKPQSVLPLMLANKISKNGLILTALFLCLSLIMYPTWPIAWLKTLGPYTGTIPLLTLPLGPLILLGLFKYQDRRARLFFLLGVMPQRVVYDQLPLLLIADSWGELLFLVLCSWIGLPILLWSGGWLHMPINWQFWIMLTLYVPALIVLLWPNISEYLTSKFKPAQKTLPS